MVTWNSSSFNINILLVDDSESDRHTYIRYLQSDSTHTYNIMEAETLAEGLELWKTYQPDIVLADYFLPDGEGWELLAEMGKDGLLPKLDAIVLTGKAGDERVILKLMRLGVADYIEKGEVTPLSLCNRVGQLGDRILLNRQLQRSQQQELLIARISLHIRQYLDLEEVSQAIVREVRLFLNADRTVIYKFNPDFSGGVVAESVLPPWESCMHRQLSDEYFPETMGGEYRKGRIFIAPDVYAANLSECHLQMLESFPTRASLIVPILRSNNQDNPLWGLLCTYQCFESRPWEEPDIRLLQQLSVQFAIALQQAELYRDLQISNTELENRVNERTAELFKRQQEFIALVENSPNVIVRLDRQSRILYINSATEAASGIPPSEFLGKTFREMKMPEKNVLMAEERVSKLLATGEQQEYEIDFPSPKGGLAYYKINIIPEYGANGAITTMLMVFSDITSNVLSGNALREANRRWQSLLDNVRLIVVGLNTEGSVEYANSFFLETAGYKLEEVIGKNWFSNFLPEYIQEELDQIFDKALVEENFLEDFRPHYQNPIITKSGEERDIAWNNTVLRDPDNKIVGTISIGEDITDKLKVDKIKSEFISIVSHELRTPLASIRGALGLLASGVLDTKPDTAKHMLDIAVSDTERLVRLVNDILDLERLSSSRVTLDRHWHDVADLCRQAIATMEALSDQSQISVLCDLSSIQIWTDGDRLVQTLVNLLSNAIKFSPPHSEVHLTVESQFEEILFKIIDHGRGIPEEYLENIFERFNQVDASDARQKGGTGLGLAICRSIVQQHGGKIWVESVLSEGSTFLFTIPHRLG
ncbi:MULTISPECIES: ATP-binding protein [Pseudanabaena]|uniref:histidine kinase n=2 Tax=Pseudanabaena TaxID=1152 RepID=L8N8V6_9CYAN|nr:MULTISPECIES: ATP-binding protein [Pseudanabaena]ELS34658.1 multi-sensor signal transduction histidine kinase [Pseudanabaena biceps PCC 7429]MDG3493181.1 ATP-binding protein [Pseudanabaena catenata USMAC16]